MSQVRLRLHYLDQRFVARKGEKGKLFSVHAKHSYRRNTHIPGGREWSNSRPGHSTPEKELRRPLIRILPRTDLEVFEEQRKISCLYQNSNPETSGPQHIRNTDYAMPPAATRYSLPLNQQSHTLHTSLSYGLTQRWKWSVRST